MHVTLSVESAWRQLGFDLIQKRRHIKIGIPLRKLQNVITIIIENRKEANSDFGSGWISFLIHNGLCVPKI